MQADLCTPGCAPIFVHVRFQLSHGIDDGESRRLETAIFVDDDLGGSDASLRNRSSGLRARDNGVEILRPT